MVSEKNQGRFEMAVDEYPWEDPRGSRSWYFEYGSHHGGCQYEEWRLRYLGAWGQTHHSTLAEISRSLGVPSAKLI